MNLAAHQARWPAVVSFVLVGLMVFGGLARFGIWDPWELEMAEAARNAAASGDAHVSLGLWLIATSFEWLGLGPWTGRLPIAVCGLLLCLCAYLWVRRTEGERAAWLTVLIIATTPLFLLNSRQMLGEAPALLGQTLVASSAFGWAMAPGNSRGSWLWFGGLVFAVGFSTLSSGVLLGPLPPLSALALALFLVGGYRTPVLGSLGRWVVLVTAVFLLAGVAHAVMNDAAGYSHLLGGAPLGDEPPTFDRALERVFHSFAPWSAFGLVALAHALFVPRGDSGGRQESQHVFRLMLVLWATFAYASLTLFTSRYGSATYLAIAAIAPVIAVYVNDAIDDKRARWTEVVVTVLLLGLLIRDYALYPESPLSGIAVSGISVPKVFNPWIAWTVLLGIFTVATILFLSGSEELGQRRAPLRWIRAQWDRNWVYKLWILFFATLLGSCAVYGLLCFVFPLPISSIAIRVGRGLFFAPFGLALVVVGTPYLTFMFGKLGRWSSVPLLLAGIALGMYTAWGFQPALSQHLSPRNVFDRYQELVEGDEPLAAYRLETEAAKYYTAREIRELKTVAEVTDYLSGDSRRWLIIPKNKLGSLNRKHREKTQQHLFVADARSARVLLIASHPVPGVENENHLAGTVVAKAPKPQFPLKARFDQGVELLGYDLKAPQEGYVGAGQRFTLTWYWRATKRLGRSYEIFVHIDGNALRLNGDHLPVGGTYRTNEWDPGDVIVDAQELTMPGHFGVGVYELYVGLFAANKRLRVQEGPNDGDDRLRAGIIVVK